METNLNAVMTGRVSKSAWFQALPAAMQAALLELGRERRLAPGQRLFARGDVSDGMYCVAEGAIRVSNTSAGGKEALLAIIEAPQWFGEIALFDGRERTHDAAAEGATVLFHLPEAGLLNLLQQHPAYWRDFALLLTQKLRVTFLTIEETAVLPAAGRVARRLVNMAEGYGEWTDRSLRTLLVPQEQLALMLSLSRQTVNQILKQFETQGLLRLVRGGVEIMDLDGLKVASCVG